VIIPKILFPLSLRLISIGEVSIIRSHGAPPLGAAAFGAFPAGYKA